MNKSSGNRRSDRAPVVMDARCRTDSGLRAFVALVNLTAEGSCVMLKQPLLKVGQSVLLWPDTLAGLNAKVRWIKGSLAGLQFDNPLYGAVYEHLARSFARQEQQFGRGSEVPGHSTDVPLDLQRELLRRIEKAEEREGGGETMVDDNYRRLPVTGSRPGLRPRSTDQKKLQLFLG